MKLPQAVGALAALAQETRLRVYRLLVEQGAAGIPAGDIAERLGVAPPTLSFHLKELSHAGLVASRQDGRFVYYAADFAAMTELLEYLSENCCASEGETCAPAELVRRRSVRRTART